MVVSRDEFLRDIPQRTVEDVEVPGWGTMRIRSLDALELVDLVEYLDGVDEVEPRRRGMANMARVAVRCLADSEGGRLLHDDDLPRTLRKPGAVDALPVIFAAANRINLIFRTSDEKNSVPSASDDSPTG